MAIATLSPEILESAPPAAKQGPFPLRPPAFRFYLSGVPVDCISMDQAVAWVIDAIRFRESREPITIVGPNAHLVTVAVRHSRFANALRSASLAIPDGVSIVLASRVLKQPISERVTGGDLMERLCIEAARHNLSVFFLGGLPGAAEMTAQKFERTYPGFHTVGTYCPPPGFEADPMECGRIRRQVANAKPDLLFVAFGAPKQEIWMQENCPSLPVGAAIAVGAALDTQSGLRKRAPKWTHGIGLEWLYRLMREPRRLGRRYFVGNTHFVWLVAQQWLRENHMRDRITEPNH